MGVRNMVKCALFAALLCICSWLALPLGGVTFTLQTFGVFLTLGLLGGKWGSICVAVYLLLGAVGLPVFSGFQGGFGVLLGANGGFLWGFLLAGLTYWLVKAVCKKQLLAFLAGLASCYLAGTVWFCCVYAPGTGLWQSVLLCVVPYLVPDGVKLLLAWVLVKRLEKYLA